MIKRNKLFLLFLLLPATLAACSQEEKSAPTAISLAGTGATRTVETPATTAEPSAMPETPTTQPEPTKTLAPTIASSPAPPEPTESLATMTPEPTIAYYPIIPLGAVADWTATSDAVGIEGLVEVIDLNKIKISDFVFLAAEAPGVDIRLGLDGAFEDEVSVSLTDITGDTYEGRSLTLTIPDAAYDGRTFNSIGVVCFDTGEIFDWAFFEEQA